LLWLYLLIRPSRKLLSFMMRRLPMSSPFPYTTLFRSLVLGGELPPTRAEQHDHADGKPALLHRADRSHRVLRGAGFAQEVEQAGDRKSTRLNSSHVKISYAVFCLKKKIYS